MASVRRVQINGEWYDASAGMSGINLTKFGGGESYTARQPFAHITDLYHVYNSSGSQVGEFNVPNRTYSGAVTNFEA